MTRSVLPLCLRLVVPKIDRVRLSGRVERLPKDWRAIISFLVLAGGSER